MKYAREPGHQSWYSALDSQGFVSQQGQDIFCLQNIQIGSGNYKSDINWLLVGGGGGGGKVARA
jgi:hypothetical protein